MSIIGRVMRFFLAVLLISTLSLSAQFTVGGLGTSMGIMGTLQGMGTSAITTGNNAVNNLSNSLGNSSNQSLTGGGGITVGGTTGAVPGMGSGGGLPGGAMGVDPITGLPIGVQINPQTGLPITTTTQGGGMGGMGGGVQVNPQTGLPVTTTTGTTQGGGMGGGVQVNPQTGLPITTTTQGGGMGGAVQINPQTGLPVTTTTGTTQGGGMGGPKPQPTTRPSVGPVAMPVSVSNVGSGKKYGPVMRMVSMTGFRGFSVNSRPNPKPRSSASSLNGLSLNSKSVTTRTRGTLKSRSARPTNVRGASAASRGSAGRMFIRMRRTPGR